MELEGEPQRCIGIRSRPARHEVRALRGKRQPQRRTRGNGNRDDETGGNGSRSGEHGGNGSLNCYRSARYSGSWPLHISRPHLSLAFTFLQIS